MPDRRQRDVPHGEAGFTMILTVIATLVVSLLVGGALAAVNMDLRLTGNDLDHKRAYAAAKAGIADYAFHLNRDTHYWLRCTDVPTPNALNQAGSTANRRHVPGDTGAEYAIELVPATGHSSCDVNDPEVSMLESTGTNTGTFRIRSTGYSNDTKRSVVATFKRSSFLDYVYFTQLETSDPVTYGNAQTIAGAYQQCTKTTQEGRNNAPIPNSGGLFCTVISFITADHVAGPFHTNDTMAICGTPRFGRTAADAIEVSAPPQGWFASCTGSNQPQFDGTYTTNSRVLTPPPTNSALASVPGALHYTGQTRIVLNGTNMTVSTSSGTVGPIAIPESGLIYVANGSCSSSYSPFTVTYPSTSGCGNVLVSGTYSSRLTIAAENDIIVDGNITRTSNGILGLIANNFVRVKHPFSAQTARGQCNGGSNGTGSLPNLRIDAAILAVNHSFIVDHYDCGAHLGTLTVNGAISQKFRGPVGTFGSQNTGYAKAYTYDDRLHFQEPPHFIDPVQSAWTIQRETLDYDG